jgi:hypothetical protein
MKIYTNRISTNEREALALLATRLRDVSSHELSYQLAATLDQWATAAPGGELSTATLDASAEQMKAAWEQMAGRVQVIFQLEFNAASECRFAARGAGMGAPQSFSDNVADAHLALSAAQR